jgi:hypothetical protein
MLTNVHTWILRELIKKKKIEDSLDIYLYNIAPDSLPMHKEISPQLTHNIKLGDEILSKYPKLVYVKYHIMVDNIGHYGDIKCPKDIDDNFQKNGYAYIKGRNLINKIKDFYNEFNEEISDNDALYMAHIVVEISLDLKLSIDDKSIAELFFLAGASLLSSDLNEYCNSLAELYNLKPNTILESRMAPVSFYGKFDAKENFFLNKRVRLILRKAKKDFTKQNIEKAKKIVVDCLNLLDDYKNFLDDCVKKIEHADKIEIEKLTTEV